MELFCKIVFNLGKHATILAKNTHSVSLDRGRGGNVYLNIPYAGLNRTEYGRKNGCIRYLPS